MLRWMLLILALIFAGAASLTWLRAPTIWLWMTSILVGEYGHLLFVLPLAVGGCAWVWGGELRYVTIVIAVVAAGAFLKPVAQAVRISRELPAQLEKAFGKADVGRTPFSLGGLFASADKPVAIKTIEIAPGLPMDFYPAAKTAAAGDSETNAPAFTARTTPAPCVVMIHGGGWDSGNRTQLPAVNHHLARRGYAVAAVSYRLAPGTIWPGQADDIEAAVAYLKAHATELGIDPWRIVLMGRSAGGQIASAVAYGKNDPAVRGVVSFYGPHDQVFAWQFSREDDILNAVKLLRQYLGGTPETAPEAYRTASGYLIVNKQNAVPTLMVHGLNDSMVWSKQSERLHAKLDGLGVTNAFVSLPWATHACDFNPRGPSGQLSWYALDWFLETVTR